MEHLLLKQGLEYSVTLTCGHEVVLLSKQTAEYYRDEKNAVINAPTQGPHQPLCGDTGAELFA